MNNDAHAADSGEKTVRVDGPHAAETASETRPAEPPAVAIESQAAIAIDKQTAVAAVRDLSQVRTQATQLASHLHNMREDLQRRESELNARTATVESHMRGARLWIREQEGRLEEREAEIEQRERELANAKSRRSEATTKGAAKTTAKENKLATETQQTIEHLRAERRENEAANRTSNQRLTLREQQLRELSRELLENVERRRDAAEDAIERRRAEYEREIQSGLVQRREQIEAEYRQAKTELDTRQSYLDSAEALLVNSQADLEVQQQQLKMHRGRCEEDIRDQRAALAQRQHQLEKDWLERQQTLARRNEQLESRQAALEQTRSEVAATHREALELRLATEELWGKLSDVMPPAALTAELGKIRRSLAESYCLERSAALEQEEQLELSHARLSEQYVKLTAEKKELQKWVQSRQQDIEHQAARLVAREQELFQEQEQITAQRDAWEKERRDYQAEIRQLMSQLRRGELV